VDNLSSGRLENIKKHVESGRVKFLEGDLTGPGVVRRAITGMNTVFHLAADHGGRGYVDLHQVECSTNLILDGMIFETASELPLLHSLWSTRG